MEVTTEKLPKFAHEFVAQLPTSPSSTAHVVGLSGDLGAGKTTFVQEVARALGARGTVTSPTYVIVSSYDIQHPVFTTLVHMDAYRLSEAELHTVAWEKYIANQSNLVLVEWPERVGSLWPDGARILKFTVTGETTREITYDQE